MAKKVSGWIKFLKLTLYALATGDTDLDVNDRSSTRASKRLSNQYEEAEKDGRGGTDLERMMDSPLGQRVGSATACAPLVLFPSIADLRPEPSPSPVPQLCRSHSLAASAGDAEE
eukprot:3678616-Prymnesium_polylepis.2